MITILPQRLTSAITPTLIALLLISMTGCNNVSPSTAPHTKTLAKPNKALISQPKTLSPAVQRVIGDYVSEGYSKRAQGYDWVAVTIQPYKNDQITIEVRARSDVKKPTCQFKGQATLMGQDTAHGIVFQTSVDDSRAFFQFKGDKLIVDSQDKYALNRFCSGGGSIVGVYQKLQGS